MNARGLIRRGARAMMFSVAAAFMTAPLWLSKGLAQEVLQSILFEDPFDYPDSLLTNEYAFWSPAAAGSRLSPFWEVTSGSLFASAGAGWSGAPDAADPNAASSNGTGSCVYRMTTRRSDFKNVAVTFRLLNSGLGSTSRTPAVAWDGAHIFLRHQSEYHLYYASINRRDNRVIIKKKVPGGPSNGGTYYNLTPLVGYSVPYGVWQDIKATIVTNDNGSVTINLYANGQIIVSATDTGAVGGAPIRTAGHVGIRGDNANLKFDDFRVSSLTGLEVAPPDAVADADAKAPEKFLSPALGDGINDAAIFGPAAQKVSIFSLRGARVFDAQRGGAGLSWNGRDSSGSLVKSGLYIARIQKTDGSYCFQSFAIVK